MKLEIAFVLPLAVVILSASGISAFSISNGISGKISRLWNGINNLQAEMTTVKADNSDLRAEMTTVKAVNSGLRDEITTLKADNFDIRDKMTTLKKDNSDLRAEMTTVKADNSDLRVEMTNVKKQLAEAVEAKKLTSWRMRNAKKEREQIVSYISVLSQGVQTLNATQGILYSIFVVNFAL